MVKFYHSNKSGFYSSPNRIHHLRQSPTVFFIVVIYVSSSITNSTTHKHKNHHQEEQNHHENATFQPQYPQLVSSPFVLQMLKSINLSSSPFRSQDLSHPQTHEEEDEQ